MIANKDAFRRQNYLDKRAQVVLHALLVAFRDDMYDHTEKRSTRRSYVLNLKQY